MRSWVRQGTFIPGVIDPRGKVSRGGDWFYPLDFPGWLWREVLERVCSRAMMGWQQLVAGKSDHIVTVMAVAWPRGLLGGLD